jgi:hypothetical protein
VIFSFILFKKSDDDGDDGGYFDNDDGGFSDNDEGIDSEGFNSDYRYDTTPETDPFHDPWDDINREAREAGEPEFDIDNLPDYPEGKYVMPEDNLPDYR